MDNLKIISGNRSISKDLDSYTKEELIEKIKCLEVHNTQLRNIISKSENTKNNANKKQKPFNFEKAQFRHVLLKFFYLGWDYQGFATQEDTTNTIEYHLFSALTKTCLIKSREISNYHRCGRTDKGVSAFSQVISIDLRSKFKSEEQDDPNNIEHELEYCKILNRVLPDNIQCIGWCPVKNEFSARFDCNSRTYKYFFPKGSLDLHNMTEALSYLKGTHDFRNFCKMDVANGVVNFVRNITEAFIECSKKGACHNDKELYDICTLTIKGQAFLWHQIRCIVGILFLIGTKKEQPEVIKELLDVEKNPRKPEYNMASEIPLNLFDCDYDIKEDNWIYEKSSIGDAVSKLQESWTINTIKATMVKTMLDHLKSMYNLDKDKNNRDLLLTNCLLQGVKPKVYKPLMERQRCEGLEDRIEHFIKKRRLFVEENKEMSDNILQCSSDE